MQRAHNTVRSTVSHLDGDRALSGDIAALASAIESGGFNT